MLNLRPYQTDALNALLGDLSTHQKLGLIMPTGAGKTVVFQVLADEVLKASSRSSVLILSDRDILTQQTYSRIKHTQPHLTPGIFQASDMPDYFTDVVISTVQTSRDAAKFGRFLKRMLRPPGLVIVDEAHHIITESYEKVLGYLPGVPVVGCTASPFAKGRLMTNYFDKVSYSISLQELIDQGYLVPPDLQQLLLDDTSLEGRMALVVRVYLEKEKGKKAIVFMRTKEDSAAMRNLFVANGVNASVVSDEITGKTRQDILTRFHYKDIDVLISVDVLTKGFDCDRVEAIFMPYPVNSPATWIQRIGRGLRLCPEIGKKSCRIYVVGDAPSIKRGVYTRALEMALDDGHKERKPTVHDELEWMMLSGETSGEEYEWTKNISEAARKLESLGLRDIALLLAMKKFPKKFLKDVTRLTGFAEGSTAISPSAAMLSQQTKFLEGQGFSQADLAGLDKASASSLIAMITNYKNRPPSHDYEITEGRHAGKHVKDLPPMYLKWIFKNAPRSQVAETYRRWKREKGEWH